MENTKTILLVEDEALIAMAEEMALNDYGYNVIVSHTGEEALDIFRNSNEIDLVLMDIDLGTGIDGPETAVMILDIRTIPVVFLSSHTEPEIVEKTEKITSYGYVVKNSGITVLDASIKMAFRLFDANMQIAESENKQKAMISNISDVIGIIGADGIMKYKSPNIEKLFGWKPEDLVGTNGFDTVHPDDLERIQHVFYTLLEQYDMPHTVEYNYKCKDGSYRPVELTAVNCIHNPAIHGILLNYKDISERKAAADALRKSEARYIKAQEIGHVGNWEYNLQTTHFWGSDEARRIYGFDPGQPDFSTEEVESCIPERDRVHQALVDLIQEGKEYNLEFEIHPKDQSEPRTIWSVAELQRDDNGTPLLVEGVIQDITVRKRAEDTLTRNNQELNAIMEELEAANEELNATNEELLSYQNELIARECELQHMFRSMINAFVLFESVFDGNGTFISYRFIYINDAYEKITGVKNDEVRGKTVHEVWPGTEASWVEAYGSVAVTGIQKSFEMYHEPTGNLYHCNVYRPWDTPERFCVIFEDISQRTRIEQELRQSEQKYRKLFENMVHGVFYQSADGTLVDINQAGLAMFGLSRDQFMGRTSYHPEWRVVDDNYTVLQPEQHPSMVALHTAQEVNVVVGVFNPAENIYRWLSVHARPQFKDRDEKPYEVFVTMHDITKLKQAEIALRESELKYRSLIENSSDVVFCVNEKGEYQFTNKTFASTFGKTPDYFIGKSFWDIYPKEHADYRQATNIKVFDTGETQSIEV
ncbi:MAG TPA: PAS domain S-box protein, partial [Spirochaetota bacterium]|nr:PAS domain S-box protein [Spirochaetota bacterium]